MENRFTIKGTVISVAGARAKTVARVIGKNKPFGKIVIKKSDSINEMSNVIAKTKIKIAQKRNYAQIAKNINNAYAKMHSHAE